MGQLVSASPSERWSKMLIEQKHIRKERPSTVRKTTLKNADQKC